MKKIILPLLLFIAFTVHAQPKLVGTLGYYGTKDGGAIFRSDLPAGNPGAIYSFDHLAPRRPGGGVTAGDADWLYGTTGEGGANKYGVFYRVHQDGTGFTSLFDFESNFNGNPIPYYHTDGKVYFANDGDIKTYNTADGTIGTINTFFYVGSKNFCIDANDWIYYVEGFSNPRLVKIKTDGTGWFDLHNFTDAVDGYGPKGNVTEIPGDSLAGVMLWGGPQNGGILYSIKKDGTGFTILHEFINATGINPESKLVYFDGKLYGSTMWGGSNDRGVLFCINPDGSNYRVLTSMPVGINASTSNPSGNISISSNGRIFGAFSGFYQDLSFSSYRLYKADTSGDNFQPIFIGDITNGQQRGNGGNNLDVLLVNDEDIFFTTTDLGRFDGGVLNHSDTTGNLWNDLYHYGYSPTGFRPLTVIKGSDGKLYGTATIAGTTGDGAVFSMNIDGTGYTQIHQFTDAEGYQLSGKLMEGGDGKLYGACRYGGPTNTGTIFRMDKNGANFQVVYSFPDLSTGYSPVGDLVEDNSGVIYGTTFYGGPDGVGNLFKMNRNGSGYTVLKNFDNSILHFPYCGVARSGSWLFGTCGYGGPTNSGGVYRIRTNGTGYQELHVFNGTDGELPTSPVAVATNGKLYGTTAFGGSFSTGTVYSLDSTGTNFATAHHLEEPVDGAYPWGGVIQGSDGLIYGITTFGNTTNTGGNIFRINLNGSNFTIVRGFDMPTEGQGIYSLIDLNGAFILPVQFLSFGAQKKQQSVLLTWKTAQERNSDRFDVERSSDGNSFQKIGTVTASGNTNSITTYNFTDDRPLEGMNYYQLKQVDINGTFMYSKVVSVKFTRGGQLVLSPNPATDQLNIRLPQGNDYTALSIVDASGRIVLQQSFGVSTNQKVDIRSLAKGWYTLKLQGNSTSEQLSFIKK